MSRESIMDMDLSGRIRQIQQEEGRINRGPINIAGPAGNPTQPLGTCGVTWCTGPRTAPNTMCTKCIATTNAQAQQDYYCD